MSFGITSSNTALSELLLKSTDEACDQEDSDTLLPDAKGELRVQNKPYTISQKPQTQEAKTTQECMRSYGPKGNNTLTEHSQRASPMQMAAQIAAPKFGPARAESQRAPAIPPTSNKKEELPSSQAKVKESGLQGQEPGVPANREIPKNAGALKKPLTETASVRQERARSVEKKEQNNLPLASRSWQKEETRKWWEARYHQKERQGGQQGREQDQENSSDRENKKLRVAKSAQAQSKSRSPLEFPQEEEATKLKKPELQPPKIGVFALYYILTKMGILSDGTSNFAYKKEIEFVDQQTSEAHKKRLDEVKEALKKEKENVRWGVAMKLFSWLGSCVGVISGITLIATGVGAIAGAMIIAGSVIQLASHLMEVSEGWKKIAELLPGEDSERKHAVLNWIQIGIAMLCLVLLGAGILWGGYANFNEAMQIGMGLLGGIASVGLGVTTIGEGHTKSLFNKTQGALQLYEIKLAHLRHMRKDLMEKVEWGVDRLEQLFEDLARALDFEIELFQADQMVNR